jgi:hypothetical protein
MLAAAVRTIVFVYGLGMRLISVSQVVYALETATAYAVGAWWRGLANNGMTDEQRRTLDPMSEEYRLRVGGSKTQLVGWSLYISLLWMLKLCMCHFYSRLTLVSSTRSSYACYYSTHWLTVYYRSRLQYLQTRVRIGYILIGATYVATLLSTLLGCQTFQKNWQIHPDPGSRS